MARAVADEIGQIQKSASLAASLERAHRLATEQGHSAVTLEHLLFAMTDDPEAATVLVASGLSMDRLRTDVSGYLSRILESMPRSAGGGAMPNPDLLRVLNLAATAARQSQRANIDGAIVLAAVVGDGNTTAAGLLKAQGLTFEEVIKVLTRHAAQRAQVPESDAVPTPQAAPPARPSTPLDDNLLDSVRERVRRSEPPKIAVRGPAVSIPQKEEKSAKGVSPVEEGAPPAPPPMPPAPPSKPVEAVAAVVSTPRTEPLPAPRTPPPVTAPPAQPAVLPISALPSAAAAEGGNRQAPPPVPPARSMPPPPAPPTQAAMPPAMTSGPLPEAAPARGPAPQHPAPLRPPVQERSAPNLPAPEQRLAEYRPEVRGGQPLPAHMLPPAMQSAPPVYGHPVPPQQPAYQPPARMNDGGFVPPRPDMAQAVTGIPETMVVGHPSLVEVQFASADFLVGAGGRGPAAGRARPIRAISVRLTDERGAFTLEAETPETLWLDAGQPGASVGTLNWSFAVTPRAPGRHQLGLVVTSRVIGPLGFINEPPIPAEAVDVLVKRDRKSAAQRAIITIAAALAGAAVWATAGGQIVAGISAAIRLAGLR